MSLGHMISTLLLLTVVGAIIGGATNYIAIKMLFKPSRPVMIGRWRVPFTPGLIPKRHEEIAVELGRLVMKHLITADGLKLKLLEPGLADQVSHHVQNQVSDWLEQDESIGVWLEKWTDSQLLTAKIEKQAAKWLNRALTNFLTSKEALSLGEMLPMDWINRFESHVPDLAMRITESLSVYLESDEGKAAITSQLNHLFESKGFFGNMLGLFLGNQSIIDKLYPELISFLRQPAFADAIEALLRKEWERWLSRPFGDVIQKLDLESDGKEKLIQYVIKQMPIRSIVERRPKDVLGQYEPIIYEAIPRGVQFLIKKLAEWVPDILRTLDLASIVTEQVRHFSIQELEDVVLMISKKEFKMITYLGALLGGLIGVVQAVIVIMMG
ncbi:MAG: DUF445 family protein [Tuberibacillus sp.]